MPKGNVFDRLRLSSESSFARWGEICHDHPWRIIALVVVAVGFFSSFLPTLQLDMSTQSYLRKDDPARVTYNRFQREFGRDDRIILVIHARSHVISEGVLRKVQQIHEQAQALPQVAKVDSLINARLTLGRGDELIVRDLLEEWPTSPQDFQQLRKLVESRELIRDNYLSNDGLSTIVVVTPDAYTAEISGALAAPEATDAELDDFDFDASFGDDALVPETGTDTAASTASEGAETGLLTDAELFAVVENVVALGESHSSDDLRISVAGPSYLTQQLTANLTRDMALFTALGMLVIAILLTLTFRRWIMVILPVGVALLAVQMTFAMMSFLGITVTSSTQILPSLLLAVGVGNAVHILTVFFQSFDAGRDKREALSYALGHSGLAVVMTALTTAGGLASFLAADMKAVADIGVASPIGILAALFFSLTLLPALLSVCRFRKKAIQTDEGSLFQRFLMLCARVSTHHPVKMVAAWGLLIVVSLYFASGVRPSHNPVHWFEPGSPLRVSMEDVNDRFGGATYLEIVVDSGETNGLHNPRLLHTVDSALQTAAEIEMNGLRMGPTTSLLNVNKELHQALNGNDPAYYRIPDDRALVAQELLLFENSGSDDLQDLVDTPFRKMRITAKLPFLDSLYYRPYLEAVSEVLDDSLGDMASYTLTGVTPLFSATMGYIISDTVRSYLIAFAVIAPLMMLLVGSARVGLISMIPNLAPIVITLALMYLLELPLDMFSVLIGSIALGLAVDDTIHFMHNYQRYYKKLGDSEAAVRETLRTTGKALMITTLVLAAGFAVNMAGSMVNMQHFGLLTAFCIIVAFLADVLLAPALVTLIARWKEEKKTV